MKPLAQGIAVAAFALSFAFLIGGAQSARAAACNDGVLEMQAQLDQIKDEATKMEVKDYLDKATAAAAVQDEVQCQDHLRKAQERAKR